MRIVNVFLFPVLLPAQNLIWMLVNQLDWQHWKSLQGNCIEDLGVQGIEKWLSQSAGQYERILHYL